MQNSVHSLVAQTCLAWLCAAGSRAVGKVGVEPVSRAEVFISSNIHTEALFNFGVLLPHRDPPNYASFSQL